MEDTAFSYENYLIKKNNQEYSIILKYSNSLLEIDISLKDSFQICYSKNYTLDELKASSNFFLLFNKISDVIPNVKKMLSKEKKRDLEIGKKIIKLILIPPIDNIDNIILVIPQKYINKDEIIQELIKTNNDFKKRIEVLEKEMKEIKEEIKKNKEMNLSKKIIDSDIIHNHEEIQFIINCLGKNNLIFIKLYQMSKDGDKEIFHKKCDHKGPTLCLFKIKGKDIRYGGFTSVSWDTKSNEKRDENAFIFSINNKKMFKSNNYNSSIFCRSDYGPFFGGNCSTKSAELWYEGRNNCGFYNNKIYKDLNKECTQGLKYFSLDELEVFEVHNYK
jgi:hypothetical protein